MATEEHGDVDLALEMRQGFAELRTGFSDLREGFAELRTRVGHLEGGPTDLREELRTDIRRLDGRVFQLLIVQVATLATIVGALIAFLAS